TASPLLSNLAIANPFLNINVVAKERVASVVATMGEYEERVHVVGPGVIVPAHVGAVEVVLPDVAVRPVEPAFMPGLSQQTVEAVADVKHVGQVLGAAGENTRSAEVGKVPDTFDAKGRHGQLSIAGKANAPALWEHISLRIRNA